MVARNFQESIVEAIYNAVYTKVPHLREARAGSQYRLEILVEQSHDALEPIYALRLRRWNGKIIWQTRTKNYSKLLSNETMAQLSLVSNSLSLTTT